MLDTPHILVPHSAGHVGGRKRWEKDGHSSMHFQPFHPFWLSFPTFSPFSACILPVLPIQSPYLDVCTLWEVYLCQAYTYIRCEMQSIEILSHTMSISFSMSVNVESPCLKCCLYYYFCQKVEEIWRNFTLFHLISERSNKFGGWLELILLLLSKGWISLKKFHP